MDLFVSRLQTVGIGDDPDLQEMYRVGGVSEGLYSLWANARTCRHALYIPRTNDGTIADAVFMLQGTF